MSNDKGKIHEVFPDPTKENTTDVTRDEFDNLLKSAVEVKSTEVEIPLGVLTELRRVDAEIEARRNLQQGLWTGCALGLGIDIVHNRASFDHGTGLITVIPNQA